MSAIILREVDDATIATPAAGKSALILDDVLGWAHKDDDGVTRSLQGEDGEITYSNIGNTGASEAVDWAGPDVQRLVANAATVTLTYTNVPASGTYGVKRLWLAQDGTGGRIWDFPASTDWGLAGEPDWSGRPASHVDIVDLQTVDGGTVVIASIAGREGPAGSSDLDAIITASSGQDIADALAGAAAPDAGNVFATMADVGGGGSATAAENFLTADVLFSASNTWFDGPSLSLVAGTYVLIGGVQILNNTGGCIYTARLWDGSSDILDAKASRWEWNGSPLYLPVFGYKVVASTTTFKISVATTGHGAGTSGIVDAAPSNGTADKASKLIALKIA